MNQLLAVMDDLFFGVKIQDAAKRAGLMVTFLKEERSVLNRAELLGQAGDKPLLVIVDLNYLGVDPVRLRAALKSNTLTSTVPVVGFVSHVQVELRARAEQAGFDEVFARSAFAQNIPAILMRYSE